MLSPFKKSGIVSLYKSIEYSFYGLVFAFKNEQAFRCELFIGSILSLFLLISDISLSSKVLLGVLFLFLLVIELINSAIEVLCDRVSLEFDIRIKSVKDMGSAAVFFALLINIIAWVYHFKDLFC